MVTIVGPGGSVSIRDGDDPSLRATVDAGRRLHVDVDQPVDVAITGEPVDVTVDNFPADLATNATISGFAGKVPDEEGTWDYRAGVDGTVNVPAGGRVLGIAVIATDPGATVSIDGGDAIPVPENIGVDVAPRANLVAPSIVFTNTASYLIEFVV